jgi:hypothetical protein
MNPPRSHHLISWHVLRHAAARYPSPEVPSESELYNNDPYSYRSGDRLENPRIYPCE